MSMSGACFIIWKNGLHSNFSMSQSILTGVSDCGPRRRKGASLTMPGCPFSRRLHPVQQRIFSGNCQHFSSYHYKGWSIAFRSFFSGNGQGSWPFIPPCWSFSQSTCWSCLWSLFNRLFRKSIVRTPLWMSCSSIAWTTETLTSSSVWLIIIDVTWVTFTRISLNIC